jgi:hypothetical protein
VVRVLTTFWTCCKPSSSFSFVAVNFMNEKSAKMLGVRPYSATAKSCALGSTSTLSVATNCR